MPETTYRPPSGGECPFCEHSRLLMYDSRYGAYICCPCKEFIESFHRQPIGSIRNIKPHPPFPRERELFARKTLTTGSDPRASGWPEDRDKMLYVLREGLREWFSDLFFDDIDNCFQKLKER
jgi:hypothetical protein